MASISQLLFTFLLPTYSKNEGSHPVVFEIPKYVLLILSPLLKVDPIDPEEIAKGGFQIGSPGKSYFPLIIGYGD